MATATVKRGQNRVTPGVNENNAMYLVDSQGIIALEKEGDNNVKILGFVEPEKFLSALNANCEVKTGILPPDTCYYERFYNNRGTKNHMYVFNFSPRVCPIRYRYTGQAETHVTYNLAMPWIQFYVVMREVGDKASLVKWRISCTKTPIRTMEDKIYFLPLNNIRPNGDICWGYASLQRQEKETTQDYARRVASSFFQFDFNDHLEVLWPMQLLRMPGRSEAAIHTNLSEWANLSKQDPNCFLNFDLYPLTHTTFGKIIDSLVKYPE